MSGVVASAVLCRRALREIPRVPGRIAFPMLIPIMQMILFAAVFQNFGQYRTGGAGSSLDFLAAGQVALSVLVGAGGAGFQMVQDIDSGFFDKLRVAPIPRLSIVAGLLATDAVRLSTHVVVVTLVALALGAKLATGILGLLVMMLLGGFFGAMWSGISLNVALRTKNAEITGASNVLIFPLFFGSTAFVPLDLLPSWLQTVNKVNPVSYLVDAMRTLMLQGWHWQTIGEGFLAAGAVGAVTLPLAVRAFRRSVQT
ncbi:MAG TPA: ABC transporter permease [Gaiellales bacterium]|nr:ABC transporter permease [Gaiellales bacterium]